LGLSKPTFLGHGDFSMYTHSAVRQGHTHRGQILGAAVGPGSDAQTLGFDHIRQRSRAGIFIERTRYDDDTYYRYFSRRYGEARHQVELTIGGNYLHRLGAFEVEGGVNWSMRYDRDFMALVVADPPKDVQHNWNPWFRVSWTPERGPPLLPEAGPGLRTGPGLRARALRPPFRVPHHLPRPVRDHHVRACATDRRDRLGHGALRIEPAELVGRHDHRVLARDVVRGEGIAELVLYAADDVEVGERGLDHD